MNKIYFLFLFLLSLVMNGMTQPVSSFGELTNQVLKFAEDVTLDDDNVIVSGKAMNLFIQKKVSIYLTGSSEVTLSKAYATYTAESDKLTFGFNFPYERGNNRLSSLFNPLVETDIKNNFATLFKKKEWQSNIRPGFKYSYFFPFSTINFFGMEGDKDQKSRMIRKRVEKVNEIILKIQKEEKAHNTVDPYLEETQRMLSAKYTLELNSLAGKNDKESRERSAEIAEILSNINKLVNKEPYPFEKKLEEYKDEIAKAEVDALYEKDAYTWSQTAWISAWGFYPLTERKSFIAETNQKPFTEIEFDPWELNFQFNYLREGRVGTFLITPAFKWFQNNSAMADLMTAVDYNQYLQFPINVDTLNAAILKTNKGYIGKFNEFRTTNLSLQLILALPDRKKDGGEKFLTPGVSVRYEKNFGDYSAVNWRFGLPLRFKGKDKAINVEPQLRLNNTNNYANKAEYKVDPVFGVNVGLPFTALFK